MINLLSLEERKQLKAARANSIFMRYVVMSLVVVAVIIIELVGSYFMLMINQSNSRNTITNNQNQSSKFSLVKNKAETYRSNLSVAKYILDTQVPYTDILNAIASRLPNGASLSNIAIDPTTFGTASVQIQTYVSSYTQAIEVKNSLQEAAIGKVKIFDSVSLSATSHESGDNKYQATYTVIYSKKVLPWSSS